VTGARPEREVLVVDDEPAIGQIVARHLARAGYATRVARDGTAALVAATERRPDLVLLDVVLPGVDGLEVMRRLRDGDGRHIGVILLKARGEESDRVAGLRLGADDYIVKPFSPAERVARVDAVLRRIAPAIGREETIRAGDLEIAPAARRVTRGGVDVELTAREFDLLLFLARHPGVALRRHELMERVWRFAFYTDTSTVTVHVRRLRSKIEPDPEHPRHVETVRGVGYRFVP
jgi:two-component system response regulator ResD